MTYEAALKIIEETSLEKLKNDIPLKDIATLTNGFYHEEAARAIIAKGTTLEEQRDAFNMIDVAYESCYEQGWDKPDYFDDIQVCLNLGRMIEAPNTASTDSTPIKEIVYNISTKKPVKTQETAQPQTRIAELEAELEKKNNDIEAYELQGKGVSASKHALLLTTLCHHLGGLPQNGRQSLSPILQKLYGYTEATATRALNQKFKQTDVDALAKLFSGLSPRVGNAIKEMPSIIEKQNNERLRKLNEQKNG